MGRHSSLLGGQNNLLILCGQLPSAHQVNLLFVPPCFLPNLVPVPVLRVQTFFSSDFSGLSCLLQLFTRLHLSDYRKFWNTEKWKSFD